MGRWVTVVLPPSAELLPGQNLLLNHLYGKLNVPGSRRRVLHASGAGRRHVRSEQLGMKQVPVPKDQVICPKGPTFEATRF